MIEKLTPRPKYPRDIYIGANINLRQQDDTPTVADYTPNATEPLAPSSADDKNFSYGKLWRAYANTTALLLEM